MRFIAREIGTLKTKKAIKEITRGINESFSKVTCFHWRNLEQIRRKMLLSVSSLNVFVGRNFQGDDVSRQTQGEKSFPRVLCDEKRGRPALRKKICYTDG